MEKIVFHDNKNGRQYGPDGRLTDNWNPDGPFPESEYVKVYFRVETPSYYQPTGLGFATPQDRERFHEEVKRCLEAGGWIIEENVDASKGKEHLYIHPQEISGTVLKSEVAATAMLLAENETFSLRWVDLYETVYDFTDDEYGAELEKRKGEIRKLLLTVGATKRRDLYHAAASVTESVVARVRLLRVGITDGCGYRADLTDRYVAGVMDELAEQGYMVKATGRGGTELIRTINKAEQKQRKLFIDAA